MSASRRDYPSARSLSWPVITIAPPAVEDIFENARQFIGYLQNKLLSLRTPPRYPGFAQEPISIISRQRKSDSGERYIKSDYFKAPYPAPEGHHRDPLTVDQTDLAGMRGVVNCCESLCKRVCGPAAVL
jgi:hypothetical protein